MLKIMHVSHTCYPDKGGAQIYLQDLIIQQINEHQVFLAAEKRYDLGSNFVTLMKFNSIFGILINNIILLRFILINKVDVIHLHHAFIDTIQVFLCVKILRLFRKKVKVVLTSHGIDLAVNERFDYGVRRLPVRRFFMSKLVKVIDDVIAISKSMHQILEQYRTEAGANYKITYLPNFITDLPDKIIRSKGNRKREEIVLITLSGYRPIKGHGRLLNSIISYCIDHPKQKVIWKVGGGKGLPFDSKKTIPPNLKIEPVGYVTGQVKEYHLRDADLYVSGAYYEPYGLLIIEALMNGTAVLVGADSAVRDVAPWVTNGLFTYPENDDLCLKEILKNTINNKKFETLIDNQFYSAFNITTYSKRLECVYLDISIDYA